MDRRYGDFDVTIFEHMGKQKDFLRRQLQLGARYFELRDDLISKGFKKGKNVFPNSDYFPNFLKLSV